MEQRRNMWSTRAATQFSRRGVACGTGMLHASMATGTAAVAVRQLAKLPYETGLALQLSLARKYKEARLDEVRTNLNLMRTIKT